MSEQVEQVDWPKIIKPEQVGRIHPGMIRYVYSFAAMGHNFFDVVGENVSTNGKSGVLAEAGIVIPEYLHTIVTDSVLTGALPGVGLAREILTKVVLNQVEKRGTEPHNRVLTIADLADAIVDMGSDHEAIHPNEQLALIAYATGQDIKSLQALWEGARTTLVAGAELFATESSGLWGTAMTAFIRDNQGLRQIQDKGRLARMENSINIVTPKEFYAAIYMTTTGEALPDDQELAVLAQYEAPIVSAIMKLRRENEVWVSEMDRRVLAIDYTDPAQVSALSRDLSDETGVALSIQDILIWADSIVLIQPGRITTKRR